MSLPLPPLFPHHTLVIRVNTERVLLVEDFAERPSPPPTPHKIACLGNGHSAIFFLDGGDLRGGNSEGAGGPEA